MSFGDFHGGDTHIGGYHDFGGGDVFGGGVSDSFGLGGGDYYDSYSDPYGGTPGSGGKLIAAVPYIVMGTLILTFVSFQIFFSSFKGLNVINLCLFCAGIILLCLGMRGYARTSALGSIRRGKMPKYTGDVRHGRPTDDALCDGRSWAVENKNCYLISFFDSEFGTDNAEKVYDTMKRTPGIIWMNLFVWAGAVIVFIISHIFYYELIIPYFERAVMSDQAFAFIDALTFYLPSILVLLCGAACFFIVRVRDNILHKCAIRIVKDNEAVEERKEAEDYIASQLSKKWYYNVCPNCAAPANDTQSACKVCGSSLEVLSFECAYPGSVHRLASAPVTELPEEISDDDLI